MELVQVFCSCQFVPSSAHVFGNVGAMDQPLLILHLFRAEEWWALVLLWGCALWRGISLLTTNCLLIGTILCQVSLEFAFLLVLAHIMLVSALVAVVAAHYSVIVRLNLRFISLTLLAVSPWSVVTSLINVRSCTRMNKTRANKHQNGKVNTEFHYLMK